MAARVLGAEANHRKLGTAPDCTRGPSKATQLIQALSKLALFALFESELGLEEPLEQQGWSQASLNNWQGAGRHG